MKRNYNKARNLVHEPLDAQAVTRIIHCAGAGCTRTIVEYGLHVAETRHADGVPEDLLKIAVEEAGAVVVRALCDHHGGEPYHRYGPVEKVASIIGYNSRNE